MSQINHAEVKDEAMNHESAPLISIIVAVFNGRSTLQQCIDSVAQQSYPNLEHVVMDGGSSRWAGIGGQPELVCSRRREILLTTGGHSCWVKEL